MYFSAPPGSENCSGKTTENMTEQVVVELVVSCIVEVEVLWSNRPRSFNP